MSILWLPLAVAAYFMFAVSGVIDKIIVGQKFKDPFVVSFWVAIFGLASVWLFLIGFLPYPFAAEFKFIVPATPILIFALLSGVILQLHLLYMYIGLLKEEATRVISVIGAGTPIFTIIIANLTIDESLSGGDLAAFAVLTLGAYVVTRKKGGRVGPSFKFAVLSALFAAIQVVMAKYVYDHHQFITSLVLISLGGILYAVILAVLKPSVRENIKETFASKQPKPKPIPKKQSPIGWILLNSVLGGVGSFIYNFAIKTGPVSIINALRGTQYASVFVIALVLSKKHPQLLKEELTHHSVQQKMFGIALIIVGIIIITLY